MAEFIDGLGQKWTVDLDGLLLADLKEKAGVDIVQDGLYFLEREDVMTKALVVICREQFMAAKLTDREFAKRISGETFEKAFSAVRGAAELFFPQSRWSEIQSRSDERKQMQPLLEMLSRPEMPESVLEGIKVALAEKIQALSDSSSSDHPPSASGQTATLPNVAGSSLDSLVSTPAA